LSAFDLKTGQAVWVFAQDALPQDIKQHGKTEPPGVPLEARLIAKKDTYVLDLGAKTAEEFRKALQIKNQYLPAPAVDLELEFRNSGDKELKFLVGGTNPDIPLLLKLDGDGAVNLVLPAVASAMASLPPTPVALAPGKTHVLPIKALVTNCRGREGSASYWTQPGDYTPVATYKTAVSPAPAGAKDNGKGFAAVTLTSAPVKLKVVDGQKGKSRGKTSRQPPATSSSTSCRW
jgi:hypothetical protein